VALVKKFVIILLAFVLFAGFAGCGTVSEPEAGNESPESAETDSAESPAATENPTATPEATAEPTPEKTPEPISYQWNGLELVLGEISDDVDVDAGMGTPSGKFVIVTLSIKEGKLVVNDFTGVYKTLFTLTCGGETYSPVAFEAKNASIEGAHMYADGPMLIYFDLPVDADITGAVFAMAEPS
jgi:hypothetical protein